jgi:hypothetical protein
MRKIELLNKIRGPASPAEALVQFGIGPEELSRWQELFLLGGKAALMVSKIKRYRQESHSNRVPHLNRLVPASDNPFVIER